MARSAFYSFHYQLDAWRAQQVRNMGVIEGNKPVSPNDWEEVKRGGDAGIERWIDQQMKGTSCTIVLIGTQTAQRQWVKREIQKTWANGKALLGVRIHGLKNQAEETASAGPNPFDSFTIEVNDPFWGKQTKKLSDIVKTYSPWVWDSSGVYRSIKDGLSGWIEEAIAIRAKY